MFWLRRLAGRWQSKSECRQIVKQVFKLGFLTIKSNFKPKLISLLGEGGQAKVFKAKFHGLQVAMKYIPLDKVKDGYKYTYDSYGCNELYSQEKF